MNRVAAVIVTYNSGAEIGECLDALHGCASIIVVDNGSSDRSVAEAEKRHFVTVIANRTNVGFAAAVNQGVRACDENLILLINPDAVLLGGLSELASECEHFGIAAGKLVDQTGRVQAGFTIRRLPTPSALIFECLGLNRLWPGNPVNQKYRYWGRDLEVSGLAEQPAGAFLMIRRDVFETLGGLDESFFPVWFEDVDLARRAVDRGFVPRYFSGSQARHSGGHSVGKLTGECRSLYWYVSLLRYASKHFRSIHFRAVCGAAAAGCILKVVTGFVRNRPTVAAYKRVIRLAMSSIASGVFRPEGLNFEKCSGLGGDAGTQVASHPARQ